MFHTHAELIEQRGGAPAFAAALKVRAATVRMWKLRGNIPRASWPEVLDAFPDLTIDDLRGAERSASAASAQDGAAA